MSAHPVRKIGDPDVGAVTPHQMPPRRTRIRAFPEPHELAIAVQQHLMRTASALRLLVVTARDLSMYTGVSIAPSPEARFRRDSACGSPAVHA